MRICKWDFQQKIVGRCAKRQKKKKIQSNDKKTQIVYIMLSLLPLISHYNVECFSLFIILRTRSLCVWKIKENVEGAERHANLINLLTQTRMHYLNMIALPMCLFLQFIIFSNWLIENYESPILNACCLVCHMTVSNF